LFARPAQRAQRNHRNQPQPAAPDRARPSSALVVGVVASPGAASELAAALCPDLAERIARRLPDAEWTVRLVPDRPVVAHASMTHGVAVLSLPALGAVGVTRRATDAIVRLVAGLLGDADPAGRDSPDGDSAGSRRRRRRVANRPWRLAIRLSRALVGALAAGVFALVTDDIWQLADRLGPLRLSLLTVIIGVLALYIALLVLTLVSAFLLLPRQSLVNVLGSRAEPTRVRAQHSRRAVPGRRVHSGGRHRGLIARAQGRHKAITVHRPTVTVMNTSTLPPRTATGGRPVGVPDPRSHAEPVLDVVVPVHNEQADLEPCVRRLRAHLAATFPYPFRITIADNASTDATLAIAQALAAELPEVAVRHLADKGRGRALRTAWSASPAPVLAYMDVDLSTDLAALLPLVAPLISGHSDVAIGTRLSRGSRVVRGAKRELISRGYNLLLRGTLAARFSDAQCGFKAIRADVARRLLPLVEDTGWFFDTELLVLAQQAGLRIHEVPVDWVDNPDSRVDIAATALADLRGIARLGRALATGRLPIGQLRHQLGRRPLEPRTPGVPAGLTRQLVRFGGIGVASTVAYLVLFLALRSVTGAQPANLAALLLTALANTAANRRFTFGVTGARGAARHQAQGLVAFALGLALTSGSLALLHAASAVPGRLVEVAVLVAANLAATMLRFLLLRVWVFRSRHNPIVEGDAR
jgi:putative flippase GtrA